MELMAEEQEVLMFSQTEVLHLTAISRSPSAGTGTLLMALAHKIGEDKCTIFAQDISQRSNKMLKLNLILNSLVSSLDHAIQGDTLIAPYHKSDKGQELRTFDYVVSNPPFKMDFSDTRERIAAMPVRFWAVLTYAAIIRAVWGYSDYGSVKKLQVNMKNIRKKMGVTPGEKRYIINELGVGYRMLAEDET